MLPMHKFQRNCIVFNQNGVLDSHLLLRAGSPAPEVSMATALDSRNGNVASSESPKRPKNLGMSQPNGYPKRLHGHDEEEHSSLPCTPGEADDGAAVRGGQAVNAVLENDTKQLLRCFLKEFSGLSKPRWDQTKELSTMKRVVEELLEKHRYAYKGMLRKLDLGNSPEDMGLVGQVAKNIFSDGTTNWGRVASLVSFGAAVSRDLKEKGRESCVDLVADEISTYLLSEQRDWLLRNNSWAGFVEFFRVEDPEATVRNTLMALAGVAGLGATLAFLIR